MAICLMVCLAAGAPPWMNNPQGGQQQQYSQQQQYGQQQQQGFSNSQVPFNPAAGHDAARGHHDYPHPGEHFFTTKQLWSRYGTMVVAGMIAGMLIMWKIYPVLLSLYEAL